MTVATASTVESRSPVSVLVVDDQQPFRAAATAMLGASSRFVVLGEATTGEQGVDMAARLSPALVLMDVLLPGIDGIEATRRILANHPATVVVLVSTRRASDLPLDLRTCGAAAFVPKEDVDPDSLAALVPSP